MSANNLERKIFTETQTKKNKEERKNNIKNAFEIKSNKEFQNKTVLLIDDVITTGATLIECVKVINEIEGVKIKLLLLAKASD